MKEQKSVLGNNINQTHSIPPVKDKLKHYFSKSVQGNRLTLTLSEIDWFIDWLTESFLKTFVFCCIMSVNIDWQTLSLCRDSPVIDFSSSDVRTVWTDGSMCGSCCYFHKHSLDPLHSHCDLYYNIKVIKNKRVFRSQQRKRLLMVLQIWSWTFLFICVVFCCRRI